MQNSIIVSLSLALFTLAARLLWDQKDIVLISYWGSLHLEVQLYGLPHKVVSVIYGYKSKDITKHKPIQSHLWLHWVLLFSNSTTLSPFLLSCISAFRLMVATPKGLLWYSSNNKAFLLKHFQNEWWEHIKETVVRMPNLPIMNLTLTACVIYQDIVVKICISKAILPSRQSRRLPWKGPLMS